MRAQIDTHAGLRHDAEKWRLMADPQLFIGAARGTTVFRTCACAVIAHDAVPMLARYPAKCCNTLPFAASPTKAALIRPRQPAAAGSCTWSSGCSADVCASCVPAPAPTSRRRQARLDHPRAPPYADMLRACTPTRRRRSSRAARPTSLPASRPAPRTKVFRSRSNSTPAPTTCRLHLSSVQVLDVLMGSLL